MHKKCLEARDYEGCVKTNKKLSHKKDKEISGIGIRLFLNSDTCLLYTSPSPRDRQKSRMPSSA